MSAYRQKALRDFWRERTRTILVVMAIAVGIAGFSALLSSYAILTRELNRGYLATNPASATLRTNALDDAIIAAVAASPGVSDAEPRRVVTGRIKTGPAHWRGLTLFVVKDYGNIRVSRLDPQKGAWPPAAGEILIERDAMQVAHARIGDTVTVKTIGGKEQSLRISGTVHDVGQAQARMENLVYGYITVDTLAQLGEAPFLDRLNILVADRRLDEEHIRTIAAGVKQLLESRGHPVRSVDIPRPGKHPHADIMGLLLLAMSTFGLCVLALSGVLVVNLLTAIMASEVRQIGMMKAIGGSRGQIARIYFGQALLLGMAAVIVALPLGTFGTYQLCGYMAVFLNFDIASFAVPAWVYLLVAAVGLLVPLLAAADPVWRGTDVPVREALADFGVTATAFGTSAFDRALTGVTGSFRPLLLSIRNSFRRRARLALTVATLTAGGLFFLSALNLRASMIHTLDRLFAGRKFDLSVTLARMYPFDAVASAIHDTPGVKAAEGWISTEGSLPRKDEPTSAHVVHIGAPASGTFTVIALPTATKLLALDIVDGRFLAPDDTDAIVVNTALAAKSPEMKVGNTIALRVGPATLTWKIVGISREAFSPALAYISKPYLERLGGHNGMANQVRLALDRADPGAIDAVKAALDHNLESQGVRAYSASSSADGRYAFDEHMVMIYMFLIVASAIIGGVGGLGLGTTMTLNVMERRREMGILRAIGASPRVVWQIVASEGVAIALMSWILAAVLAWPLGRALGYLIVTVMFKSGLDFLFEPVGLLIWFVVSLVIGAAASFIPAWHAARSTVRESIL